MHALLLLAFLSIAFSIGAELTIEELEAESEFAGETVNRTYAAELTELQRKLLAKYDKTRRPSRNNSTGTVIFFFPEFLHLSLDEAHQSITLHGLIYMVWYDDFLWWYPSKHNNISQTLFDAHEVWMPKVSTINSIAGILRNLEILRPWPLLFATVPEAQRSRVGTTLTTTITVPCTFDFSAYPFDSQNCKVSFFMRQPLSELRFREFLAHLPHVILGWDSEQQDVKKHISGWEIVDSRHSISYLANNTYFTSDILWPHQRNNAWSVYSIFFTFKRRAFAFTYGIFLPSAVSHIIVAFSYLVRSPDAAIYVLIANVFFTAVFLNDLIYVLPPAIGSLPRIAYYIACDLCLTVIAIVAQFWFRHAEKLPGNAGGWTTKLAFGSKMLPSEWLLHSPERGSEEELTKQESNVTSWSSVVDGTRFTLFISSFVIFIISTGVIFV